MMALNLPTRLGLALPLRRPTVLLIGTAGTVAQAYPACDAALRARLDYRLVIAVPAADVPAARRRYPHEIVLPQPFAALAPAWRARLGVSASIRAEQDAAGIIAALPGTERSVPQPGGMLVRALAGPPIASLAALKRRLGAPRAIVCLGNGPSSEDPRLVALANGAALFRVNWIWRARGVLIEPDLVFTVDPDLPGPGRRPVIVFPTAAVGQPILRRHAVRLRPPRAGYSFLDRFEPALADFAQPLIPTNGALMVALAAALQPDRLVIAGIDLYRHAHGRYPGDREAADGYAREHSAALDLAIIRAALDGFAGKAVILSDNLSAALGR
ncbi:MAG TPA: hypothetical protein VLA00_06320 [Xanthobacteraceae bacterium]|nr:hypothetical protein [Xanthobacteraceae bacterium]